MSFYHLAQINTARALAPLDDPLMRDFVDQLAPVNAAGDASPGFVWRLQSDAGDATAFSPGDDPRLLVNMTVWETPEHLKAFTYRNSHVDVLRRRHEWFEPASAQFAMWWIPAGHLPSLAEARQRLDLLARCGNGPGAFTFRGVQPRPEEPAAMDGEACAIDYRGRTFASAADVVNGDVTTTTRFRYQQHGSRVWAVYEGGRIPFGSLVARANRDGVLDMRYQHLNDRDEWRTGRCETVPERLPDGRLRLSERWQWTNGDRSAGISVLEETGR